MKSSRRTSSSFKKILPNHLVQVYRLTISLGIDPYFRCRSQIQSLEDEIKLTEEGEIVAYGSVPEEQYDMTEHTVSIGGESKTVRYYRGNQAFKVGPASPFT